MRWILATFVGAACLMSAGCSEKPTISPPKTDEILPLKLANQWWGTITTFDSTGLVTLSQPVTYRIVGDTMVQDEKWFEWELVINDTVVTDSQSHPFFVNRQDGLYNILAGSLSPPRLYYEYPGSAGDTFVRDSTTTYTIVSTDTVITVPDGGHSCYLYTSTSNVSNRQVREFLAPNTGFIMWEVYNETLAGAMFLSESYELDSLKLN